ncbi:MAG TPA: hypothetical protein VMR86_11770 [Myxococcota bacterium]|nr:hypothetical protein [Myxococcota bacterium]
MSLLVLLSVLSCSAVGTLIGGRLLLVARQTRQSPELLIGTGIFAYSSVALPSLLVMGLPGLSVGLTRAFQLSQQAGNCVSLTATLLFTWRVFRPGAGWARLLVGAAVALALFASWGSVSVAPSAPGATAMPAEVRPYVSIMVLVWGGAFLWTGLESLRFHAKMKKRLALGAASPVVCNRFLLWAVWGTSCFVLDLMNLAYNLAGLDFSRHPAPLITICASCLVSSGVWYLAFFAPESYERLILARARPQPAR